jgi:hypothetical protein
MMTAVFLPLLLLLLLLNQLGVLRVAHGSLLGCALLTVRGEAVMTEMVRKIR